MIRWLIQSIDEVPLTKRDHLPEGLLAPRELSRFAGLKTDKRCQDWLLGRWAAKLLLQRAIQPSHAESLPLQALIIEPDSRGAPVVRLEQAGLLEDTPFNLSISHCQGMAFCAVLEKTCGSIGADIERIEPRTANFALEYFSPVELAMLELAPRSLQDLYTTAIWSAKEAVLKAFRQGLSVDTRWVTCQLAPRSLPFPGWKPFDVELDPQALSTWGADPDQPLPPILGWWRLEKGFVLTLAVVPEMETLPADGFDLNRERRMDVTC